MLRERTGSALNVLLSHKRFALLALAGFALAGLTACGGGGGGGSTPPTTTLTPPLTWVVTDQCNDNRDIDLRFFQYHRSRIGAQPTRVWPPSSSAVHRTRGFGQPTTFRLACTRGQSQVVCYGGRNRGDTSGYYGRGLDGNQDCQNCCFQCPSDSSTTRRVGLTCSARSPTPTPPVTPGLPPVYTPRTAPQASGTDIPNIEISGLGSTSRFAVRNTGSTTAVIRVGTWYEPRDGSFQRMIVTRTTSVPPGRVVEVPIACMQRMKGAPARGLRFFSSPKGIAGPVQQCQQRCLSDTRGFSLQNCVWDCESTATPPVTPPATTTYGAIYAGTYARMLSWATGKGSSASEAERDAKRRCDTGSINCTPMLSSAYSNSCGAFSTSSTCPSGANCFRDGRRIGQSYASGHDRSRQRAINEAIRNCEDGLSGPIRGTCRIATGRSGNPAVLCVGDSTP